VDKKKTDGLKRTGRKPLPVDVKRVRIGCRVKPATLKFLADVDKESIGRAIDFAVETLIEAGIDPAKE
jgi:hypothetical protein